jgi:tRNA/rRNA methyltransferase
MESRAESARSSGAGWIDCAHFIGNASVDRHSSDFAARARRVRFVLVAPSHPGNIGAAARAVKAMGFARLVAVNPRVAAFRQDAEAVALSVGAVDVLASAPTFRLRWPV